MSPKAILEGAQGTALIDSDGNLVVLEFLAPLTSDEIEDFASTLPCPLPDEIREVLGMCRGIDGPLERIDFRGDEGAFEMLDIFPHGLPIAGDGFGNFWVVDLTPASTTWGPIYYASHDAPTIQFQSADLTDFLTEVFRLYTPPNESLIEDVHEDQIVDVWTKNPGVIDGATAVQSLDPVLKAFAEEIGVEWQIIDLRQAKPGDGFSWGRYGPNTEIKRAGDVPIFAYRRPEKRGLFSRLFGK